MTLPFASTPVRCQAALYSRLTYQGSKGGARAKCNILCNEPSVCRMLTLTSSKQLHRPGRIMGTIPPSRGQLIAGDAGRFSDLDARAVTGDQLTPHHMPQAAAKFTTREEGGALALPHAEHVLTRTYGARGRAVVRAEAGLPFRLVLARDIRDVHYVAGVKYNKGLRELIAYYRANFPALLQKLPRPRSQ